MSDLGEALVDAAGPSAIRPARRDDAVGGVHPDWVVTPDDATAVAAVIAAVGGHDAALVVRGGGTKLDWGAPPDRLDVVLDMSGVSGVTHHYADDLVVTVAAGTPLGAVQAVVARAGQRLAIDGDAADATIGGLLASGVAGPLRLGHGTPRDQLLGAEFARADGTLAKAGGRVVKNVAGYDIAKLMCGSYGTLGVLTSANLRLTPIPAASAWVTCPVDSPATASEITNRLLASPIVPAAIEVDLPAAPRLARAGAVRGRPTQRVLRPTDAPPAPLELAGGELSVLLEGSPAGVSARAAVAAALMAPGARATDRPPAWWGRVPFRPGDIGLKLAVPVADLYATLYSLHDAARGGVAVRGSFGVGVVYAGLPESTGDADGGDAPTRIGKVLYAVRLTLLARGGSCVVLHAPPGTIDEADRWGTINGLGLMKSIKRRFDPAGILAPGRYIDGIEDHHA